MAALCRGPIEAQPRRRLLVADVVAQNWPLSVAAQIAQPPLTGGEVFERVRTRRLRSDELQNNLQALSGALPPPAPFLPVDLSSIPRRVRQPFDYNGPAILLSAAPALAGELWSPRRPVVRRAEEAPNLLLGTFSVVPQAVLPFASGEWPIRPAKRNAQADGWPNVTLTTLGLVPQSVLPFASGEWPKPPPRRFGTLTEAPNLAISTLALSGVAPFSPVDLTQSARRARAADEVFPPNWAIFAPPDIGVLTTDDYQCRLKRPVRGDEPFGSLLQSTLASPPPAVLPFASGEWPIKPAKRFAQADGWPNPTLTTLQLAPTLVLPFASGEWPKAPPRRFGTLTEAPNLALSTLALIAAPPAPFTPVDLTQAARRRVAPIDTQASALLGVLKLLPTLVLPGPSGEWLHPKVKRFSQADGWPNTTLTTLAQSASPTTSIIAKVRRRSLEMARRRRGLTFKPGEGDG